MKTISQFRGTPLLATFLAAAFLLPCHAVPPKPDPPDPDPCDECAAPGGSRLNLLEGAMEDEYPVVSLGSGQGGSPGQGKRITVDLTLAYSSTHATAEATVAENTCLGFGWTHSYNIFLYTYQGYMFRRDQGGRITKFLRVPFTSPVRYKPSEGYFETMLRNADGTFTINYPDGSLQKFKTFSGCSYLFATPIYQMIEQRNRNGNATTLTYDSTGRLTRLIDPMGRQIIFTYDGWNRIQSITDPLGRTTRLVHAMFGAQLVQIIDPDNKTVDYEYDALFRVTKKVKKSGNTFLYSYEGGKRRVEYLNPDGTRKLLASVVNPGDWQLIPTALAPNFNPGYMPAWVTNTDGRGNVWVYAYDANAYPVTNIAPGQISFSRVSYDATTLKPTARTDANGNTSYSAYDGRGNLLAVTNCAGHITRYTYEPVFNQVTSMTDPNGFVTTYAYDAKGNRIRETDPLGFTREWSYDSLANVLAEKDKNGNVTTHLYDAWSNRVKTVDPLGNITTFAYDAIGNLIQRTDANGHATTYAYDSLDRLVAEDDPLGNVTRFGYDAEGNRTSVTDANGHTTVYAYDEQHRLTQTTDALGGVTRTAYDAAGNKIAETNASGFVTWYAYDSQNRLAFLTNALGYVTAYAYDLAGNKVAETDANEYTTSFAYDCLNRLVRQTDGLGGVTRYEYDAGPGGGGCGCGAGTQGSNLITKQTDANGKVTYFKYCPLERLLFTIRKQGDTADLIDADDAVTSSTYDRNGNRLSVATRISATDYLTNWFGFDALNHQIAATNSARDVTLTAYDPVGNVRTVTAPNGNVTTNSYDSEDRLIQVDDLIGRVASYSYDAVGNRLSQTDGNNNTVQYAYDALNRLVRTTDAMGNSSTNYYDPVGNLTNVVDRMTNSTRYAYDPLNRRINTLDALACVTAYAYDGMGNLLAITDANNHTTAYEYDALNRKVKEIYPDPPPNTRTFAYDAVGNVTNRTDQKGITTIYRYNDLYLLRQRDYPTDPDDNFTYDLAGRMLTAEKGGWLVTFAYDDANRATSTTQGGRAIGYAYNIPARTRTLVYPIGRVITETTDARGRLISVNDGALPPICTYTYDLGNRVLTRAYRNGVVAGYGYNPNNWITTLTHVVPPAPGMMGILISGFAYDYDREGNKLCQADVWKPAWSEAYRYDPICRLTNFARGDLVNCGVPAPIKAQDWLLDCLGNWNMTVTNGVRETRTHNEANEITSIQDNGGPVLQIQHDANGNLANDGRFTYEYDEENRLVQASRLATLPGDPRMVGQYAYDALGRRIAKIGDSEPATLPLAVVYLLDNVRVIEEQSPTSVTPTTYTYGNYIDEVLTMDRGGASYHYQQNALWSVVAVSDSTGSPVERYAYDAYGCVTVTAGTAAPVPSNAWGTPHSAISNPYLFTERQLDEETGLYHNRARQYNPATGRFMQRDQAELPQEKGAYLYVRGNPLTFVDPTGWQERPVWTNDCQAATAAGRIKSSLTQGKNKEFCGYVCKKKVGKCEQFYNTYTEGTSGGCKPQNAPCDGADQKVAIWHTHGKYAGPSDEDFSPDDKSFADREGLPLYLHISKGQSTEEDKIYDPGTNTDAPVKCK